jgi:hypothetical protein
MMQTKWNLFIVVISLFLNSCVEDIEPPIQLAISNVDVEEIVPKTPYQDYSITYRGDTLFVIVEDNLLMQGDESIRIDSIEASYYRKNLSIYIHSNRTFPTTNEELAEMKLKRYRFSFDVNSLEKRKYDDISFSL